MTDEMKTCTKCGETKPIDGYLWRKGRAKPEARCNACARAYSKQYQADHLEAVVAQHREYRDRNREAVRATTRANREKRAEARRVYDRERYDPEKNREKCARRYRRKMADTTPEDRRQSREHRAAIKNDPCFYCGELAPGMQEDHMTPLAKGGTDHWWNIVRACQACNLRKGTRTAEDFLAQNAEKAPPAVADEA